MNTKTRTIALTGKQEFERFALQSPGPVAVDFWAEWCGPCKAMGPILEKVADAVAGKANIGKIDVDAHSEIAAQYGIRSIPTILYFKDGELKDRSVGLVSQSDIESRLDSLN